MCPEYAILGIWSEDNERTCQLCVHADTNPPKDTHLWIRCKNGKTPVNCCVFYGCEDWEEDKSRNRRLGITRNVVSLDTAVLKDYYIVYPYPQHIEVPYPVSPKI